MLAAAELVCPSCGNLRSECSDPDRDWHPQESVCWATATQRWGLRRLEERHKDFDYKATDHNGELLMSPLEGVSVWVSDIDFESLAAGTAEQSDGGTSKPRDSEHGGG